MAFTRSPRPYRGRRRTEREPLPTRVENTAVHSPTLVLFVLIASIGVLGYTWFLLNPENRGDWLPYALVITAEFVLVTQALVSMWTILSGGNDPRDFSFHHAQERMFDGAAIDRDGLEAHPESWPLMLDEKRIGVDVFITVYGEELAKIRTTVTAALALRGEHTTWILDDGRSDAVRDLADELGARYVRRLSNNGAKAGNVNHALTLSTGEYFAIFDADFVPEPERVDTNVAAATPGGCAVTYGDWLLMYAALGSADSAGLVAEAEALPDELIDGGNSRSALLAWVLTH